MTGCEEGAAAEDPAFGSVLTMLRELPTNAAVEWADISAVDEGWCRDWVDVLVPELQEAAHLNWLWTVEPPTSEQDPDEWTISLPEDVDYWQLDYRNEAGAKVAAMVTRNPSTLMGKDLSTDEVSALGLRADEPVGGLAWRARRGWSTATISRALDAWVSEHAGRPDVTFQWNPRAAAAAVAELQALLADPGPPLPAG